MFTISPELTALVLARAELLAAYEYTPSFTHQLNVIDGKLDKWPWLDVLMAEKALKLAQADAQIREVA